MRNIFIVLFALLCYTAKAQDASTNDVKFPVADPSPADIVYFPLNAAKAKDVISPVIRVIYSRPQKKGREIFGVLEQYGKIWRFGANESTEIRFYKKVTIGGKKIKAGTYSLFAIPNKDSWTIIINKQTDKWGAFSYDETKDVARVNVVAKNITKPVEYFSITFNQTSSGANLIAAWDKTMVELPIGL